MLSLIEPITSFSLEQMTQKETSPREGCVIGGRVSFLLVL